MVQHMRPCTKEANNAETLVRTCAEICMYVRMYVRTYVCMYVLYVCLSVCMYQSMYLCIYMYIITFIGHGQSTEHVFQATKIQAVFDFQSKQPSGLAPSGIVQGS